LDAFTGPLDLLLYLVRKEEVDVTNIPVARITTQYLNYVEWLHRFDPDAAGAFLVMAAALIEIKSRMLLPTPPPETDDEEWEDPRLEIVRQLIDYREMKEKAAELERRGEERAGRFGRPGERWGTGDDAEATQEEDSNEVSLWRLFEAFNEVLKQTGESSTLHVTADDTPVEVVAERLYQAVCEREEREGALVPLLSLFPEGLDRAGVISTIIALLELIRQGRLVVRQKEAFGEIHVARPGGPARATAPSPKHRQSL